MYSRTIFILRGDEALLSSSHNDLYKFRETAAGGRSDRPPPLPPLVLRVTTDHVPRDPARGFVVGRDPARCDLVLRDGRVSAAHFAVLVQPDSGATLLANRSRHGTRVVLLLLGGGHHTRGGTHVLLPHERADVALGGPLRVVLQRFADPADWGPYRVALSRHGGGTPGPALLREAERAQQQQQQQQPVDVRPPTALIRGHTHALAPRHPPPDYRTVGRLGSGGGRGGRVFQVVEHHTGAVYALKQHDAAAATAAWLEAEMLERCRAHPHIVALELFRQADEGPQLVMEYVPGPSLQDCLDGGSRGAPSPPDAARAVLRQLLQAAAHMHARGVAHRAICPAHVVLERGDGDRRNDPVCAKLLGFGRATATAPSRGSSASYAPGADKDDIAAVGRVALALFGLRDAAAALPRPAPGRRLPAHLDLACWLLADDPGARPSANESLEHPFLAG